MSMPPELFSVDASQAMDAVVGPENGVRQSELDDMVARGRQVHDDLLLARARGQVGFGDLYMLGREAMRARETAESLANRFDNVAVLAQGAEADVASAMLGSLAHPFHNLLPRAGRAGRPRVFLVDSMDPDWLGAFLESFPVEQTLLVVVSKTGVDLGSLVQFGIVREMLKMRIGSGYQDHLVVVTEPRGGTLREEALREGLLAFEVPANVPPRFAALTPAGLFPAALAGADVRGVLGGAHGAAERTAGEDLRTNPAYLLAATLRILATGRGRRSHIFVGCTEALERTAVHVARLFEESTGRPVGDFPGLSCSSFTLSRDSATLAQRCLGGARETAVVLLDVVKPTRDRVFPAEAPGLEWLAERQLSDVVHTNLGATRAVLREAGVPVVTLRLPSLAANSVGALHMASMLSASFGAGLAGIDPFSLPGADRRARRARAEIGDPDETRDAS
jgi:glucose-6-phosphate isomerase